MDAEDKPEPHFVSETGEAMVRAYRPLHMSFLVAVGFYYAYVTAAHLLDETGLALTALVTLAMVTGVAATAIYMMMRRIDMIRLEIELSFGLLHLLMFANVAGYQIVHYQEARLVYFPLLAMAFAVTTVSQFAAILMVVAAVAIMCAIVWIFDPASITTYVFIGITTLVVALGLSAFVRNVVWRQVQARLEADAKAEHALRVSAENARLAETDPLTGLPNRRGFFTQLAAALASDRLGRRLSVGIIDLDGFKAINDVFGHGVGDHVLVDVASRLTYTAGAAVTVTRLGGDEFGVIVEDCVSEAQLRAFSDRIIASLEAPFRYEGVSADLSASCGFSFCRPGDTAETLLDRADFAVYEAKATRRSGTVVFSAEHEQRILAERGLERALLEADLEREIVPVYQPIVDAETGGAIAFEALARWTHPELGSVPPSSFVPAAERLGLLPTITQAMARHALDFVQTLPSPMRISVNLSPVDLASAGAVDAICRILDEAGPGPCRLDFEITETAVMRDALEANTALLKLMQRGARISLDDFGTGHSSLSRIRELPLSRVKIDRSFIESIESDLAAQAIVRTTIDLCRNLGLSCVIEGVERVEQVDALRALGARHFQGYYFGRPMRAQAADAASAWDLRYIA